MKGHPLRFVRSLDGRSRRPTRHPWRFSSPLICVGRRVDPRRRAALTGHPAVTVRPSRPAAQARR
jgi:hypothetical protein